MPIVFDEIDGVIQSDPNPAQPAGRAPAPAVTGVAVGPPVDTEQVMRELAREHRHRARLQAD